MPEKTSAPTRRSIGQVLHDWDPDRHWHVPLILTGLTYALGWAPTLGALPFWVMLLAGIAVLLLGQVVVRSMYPTHIFGPHQNTQVRALAGTAGAAITAWWVSCSPIRIPWVSVAGLQMQTHWLDWVGWTPVSAPALWSLVLGGLVLGGWFAVLDARAPVAQERTLQQLGQRMEDYAERQIHAAWIEIMANSGFAVEVVHHEDTEAGYAIGIAPADSRRTFTFEALEKSAKNIAVNASLVLSRDGDSLGADAIRIEPTRAAHVSVIHVKTKALLTGDLEYVPDLTRRAVDPADFGKFETGGTIWLSLHDTHGATVGATGSGKSVFSNVLIGRGTEPVDMDTWLLATDKLVPLAYLWLKPWLQGLTARPIFGVVAGQDPQQVLQALAWAYLEMRQRNAKNSNRSKHTCTPSEPAIKIVIEEAADVMQRTDTIFLPDGREVSASKLVQMIAQAGRSACVTVEFVVQSALYEALGNKGNQTNRNVTRRVALRTMTVYDGQATLVGMDKVDTTKLRDHTMLVQDSIEVPQAIPAKSAYLEEDLIEAVVLANTPGRPGQLYEAGMAQRLGRAYAERWDARHHPELVEAARMDGLDWPVRTTAPAAPTNTRADRPELDVDGEFARISGTLEEELRQMNAGYQDTAPTADGIPDVTEDLDNLNALQARTQTPAYRMLNQIMSLLSEPGAPAEFVSTRQLAVKLGRVPADASGEDKDAAATALGQEISGLIPGLKTKRSRQVGGRSRGYEIARLREVHKALATGEPIRPDVDE